MVWDKVIETTATMAYCLGVCYILLACIPLLSMAIRLYRRTGVDWLAYVLMSGCFGTLGTAFILWAKYLG